MTRPFIAAPNTASVEMIYSVGGETCENLFHVHKASPYSLADLQALRGTVLTWYTTVWKGQVHSTVTLVRIRTKALDTDIAPMEDYAVTSGGGGGLASGSLVANNVTYCLKLATGLSGRSARGRWYFIGMSSNSMLNSVDVSTPYRDAVVANLATLRTQLSSAGHTFCVTSYRHNNAWRTTAVNYDIVSVVAVDLHIDSQRRRLAGRGQ